MPYRRRVEALPGADVDVVQAAGEQFDICVNGWLGRAEANKVVPGDRYGVRITEFVAGDVGRGACVHHPLRGVIVLAAAAGTLTAPPARGRARRCSATCRRRRGNATTPCSPFSARRPTRAAAE